MSMAAVLSPQRESYASYLAGKSAEVAIMRNGFIEVPVEAAFLRPRLAVITQGMKRITDTPGLRSLFPYRIHERNEYGKHYNLDVGLEKREDDELKWFFQYTPGAYPLDRATCEDGSFLSALRDLDEKALEISLALAECFDKRNRRWSGYPNYAGSMVERLRSGIRITRVLRYPKTAAQHAAAHPHIDRGIFTVHWGATHEGLSVRTPGGEWTRVRETGFETVAVFPGRKFGAISRGTFGDGTPHGVRYDRVVDEDRYAFVTFVHPETLKGDAQWLRENHDRIKAYEKSLTL